MVANEERLKAIWNQDQIPVVLRRGEKGQKLRVRLPERPDNTVWINTCGKSTATWMPKPKHYWELPKNWFNTFVEEALKRYKQLYVIQPYREQEICARACQEAKGHECNCSCMGAHHGSGMGSGWFEVDDTFATRWSGRELACRLMKLKTV